MFNPISQPSRIPVALARIGQTTGAIHRQSIATDPARMIRATALSSAFLPSHLKGDPL